MEPFSTLLALCEENLPETGQFLSHRPVTRSYDGFFLSTHGQTPEQTIETPVSLEAIVRIMTSL